jgi:hypothetical protein
VSKLLLMASMVVLVVLPLRASRAADAVTGLRVTLTGSLLFNLAWAVVLLSWFLFQLDDPQSLLPAVTEP